MTPQEISVELAIPLRPRNGIQLIMRMMFEVQERDRAQQEQRDLPGQAADVKGQKVGNGEADQKVKTHVRMRI